MTNRNEVIRTRLKPFKISFFFVVDSDIPRIIEIFRLEKSQFYRVARFENFRICNFLDRIRQKRREYAYIPEAFNKVISKICDSKTSSDYFISVSHRRFELFAV